MISTQSKVSAPVTYLLTLPYNFLFVTASP